MNKMFRNIKKTKKGRLDTIQQQINEYEKTYQKYKAIQNNNELCHLQGKKIDIPEADIKNIIFDTIDISKKLFELDLNLKEDKQLYIALQSLTIKVNVLVCRFILNSYSADLPESEADSIFAMFNLYGTNAVKQFAGLKNNKLKIKTDSLLQEEINFVYAKMDQLRDKLKNVMSNNNLNYYSELAYLSSSHCAGTEIACIQMMYPWLVQSISDQSARFMVNEFKLRCDSLIKLCNHSNEKNIIHYLSANNYRLKINLITHPCSIQIELLDSVGIDVLLSMWTKERFTHYMSFTRKDINELIVPCIEQLQAMDLNGIQSAGTIHQLAEVLADITGYLNYYLDVLSVWVSINIKLSELQMEGILKELTATIKLINDVEDLCSIFSEIYPGAASLVKSTIGSSGKSDNNAFIPGKVEEIRSYNQSKIDEAGEYYDKLMQEIDDENARIRFEKNKKIFEHNKNVQLSKTQNIEYEKNSLVQINDSESDDEFLKAVTSQVTYSSQELQLLGISAEAREVNKCILPLLKDMNRILKNRVQQVQPLSTKERSDLHEIVKLIEINLDSLRNLYANYSQITDLYTAAFDESHRQGIALEKADIYFMIERIQNRIDKNAEQNRILDVHREEVFRKNCLEAGKDYVNSHPGLKSMASMMSDDVIREYGRYHFSLLARNNRDMYSTRSNYYEERKMLTGNIHQFFASQTNKNRQILNQSVFVLEATTTMSRKST